MVASKSGSERSVGSIPTARTIISPLRPRSTPRPGRLPLPLARGRSLPHLPAMETTTVWYDGACPLCRAEIAWVRRLDRAHRIAWVDVASTDAACPIDRGALLRRFHARADGQVYNGAAAFAAMWRAIPALRPLGLAARNPVVLALLERLYRGFLRVRPRLQRLVARASAA